MKTENSVSQEPLGIDISEWHFHIWSAPQYFSGTSIIFATKDGQMYQPDQDGAYRFP